MRKLKEKEKENADRGKKENKQFTEGEDILLRKNHKNWIPAKVINPEQGAPRSYIVKLTMGQSTAETLGILNMMPVLAPDHRTRQTTTITLQVFRRIQGRLSQRPHIQHRC